MKHIRCRKCNKIVAILPEGGMAHKEGVYCAECYKDCKGKAQPNQGPVDCPEFFKDILKYKSYLR